MLKNLGRHVTAHVRHASEGFKLERGGRRVLVPAGGSAEVHAWQDGFSHRGQPRASKPRHSFWAQLWLSETTTHAQSEWSRLHANVPICAVSPLVCGGNVRGSIPAIPAVAITATMAIDPCGRDAGGGEAASWCAFSPKVIFWRSTTYQ